MISLTEILAIEQRSGLGGWLWPGANVYLRGGVKLRLTADETAKLDERLDLHAKTMQVLGVVKELQNNRPGR